MGGVLEIVFLLFTTFSTVYAGNQNACPTSFCGSFSLSYPFKLQNIQLQDNCTYINLTCNATLGTNGTAIVSLPYGGDFYVRYIGYYDPFIQLYDPGNCLMGRLMKNLNLSSSPFKAVAYENYTFYTCPSNSGIIGYYVFPIDCLSNSTNSTVATTFVSSEYMFQYGCQVIGSWLLPVLGPGQFEFDGIKGDPYLTWNSTSCIACEDQPDHSVDAGNSWDKFAVSPFFIPSFVTMAILLAMCLLGITKSIAGRNETYSDSPAADALPVSATATAAAPAPRSTAGGLDESKINSCTELNIANAAVMNLYIYAGNNLQLSILHKVTYS
ncbi:hypothetical protein Pfo_005933 [Paulownia fortunei]|nr:hypothetical protein Pfo_005933 [Paulownia fortunei]